MGRTLTLRYFASTRETIGIASEPYGGTAATLAELRDELIARGGGYAQALARGRAVRMAVDQALCPEDRSLDGAREVAFFPPVTGG